jgi:EAL domain-containing protein (putative c-di-GMP-specific phosphodiesterase class I)
MGLESAVDHWAVRTATRQMGDLIRAGVVAPATSVAVNLSANNLAERDLERETVSAAEGSGLPAGSVTLEITEGALVQHNAVAVLSRLRELGFGIAIDDFGTGFSSLAYLRALPVSTLKIDRSFVADITTSDEARSVVTAILDLAKALGLVSVAEGVETLEQAILLRQLGCDTGQGWLWSPARAASTADSDGWQQAYHPVQLPSATRVRHRERPEIDDLERLEHATVEQIRALHSTGASPDTIAAALDRAGRRTSNGLRWHRSSVLGVITRLG